MRSKRAPSFSVSLANYLTQQLFLSTQTQNCTVELGADISATKPGDAKASAKSGKTYYWGGSTRTDNLPDEDALEDMEILAVRGPATASALEVSSTLPQGDLTLFLPVFYKPESGAPTEGKTVFIPDENDSRPDSEFARLGCDAILRPTISKSNASLFELIDAIVGARFVLTSSLTVAMVAAAYGRPFARWPKTSGPDKTAWQDFTALLGVPNVSADSLKTAQSAYQAATTSKSDKPRVPALSAFLASAPFPIRPEGLLKILDHEIRLRGNNSVSQTIEQMVRSFMRHRVELETLTRPAGEETSAPQEPATTPREKELLELVSKLEEKARDAENREKNLIHSIELLGEKIGKSAPPPAQTAKRGKQGNAELQRQLEIAQERAAELEKQLNTARNIAELEGSMIARQLSETQAALEDTRKRYRKIHNSRTWKMVRASRSLRKALSPKALMKKVRKQMRGLLSGQAPAKDISIKVIKAEAFASGNPSELAIVIMDTGQAPSPAALERIKSWIAEGYDVTICGRTREWSKLGATVIACEKADAVHAVNRAITDSRSAFVLLLNSLEHDVKGLDYIKPGFVNFDQLALACAVENHGGQVYAAGADFDHSKVVPLNKGAKVGGANVTRIMPTRTIWPTVTVFDQDSFMHLGALPYAKTIEEALIAYAAKVRARGLEIAVNGLLTTEQPHPPANYPINPQTLDSLGTTLLEERPWVLFTDGHTPTPDRDSGSIDIYWFMRIFQEMGYQIAFIPYHHRDHAGRYTDELRLMGIETVQSSDYDEPWQHLRDYGHRYKVALVYRVTTAAYILEPIRVFSPEAKIIFDTVDLHFLREEMAAKQSGNKADEEQAQATRVQELKAMDASDATILLSASEDALIAKLLPTVRRKLVSLVRHIPGRTRGAEGRSGAIFVGGFRHSPNIDAALYLCRDIWPLVRKIDPTITVDIIGADAPEQILDLHNPSQGINVVGRVPTLDDYYDKARINLAPLTFGAGVKGKVAASLSVGLPTVGTSVATDGMWLTPNKDVLVADTAKDFAESIVKLNNDDELWETLSINGIQTAQERFSIAAARKGLTDLLDDLGVGTPNR